MKDIKLNDSGDIQFANNDFVIETADAQTAITILSAATGEFKENPLLGADTRKMIGGGVDPFWKGRAKAMLEEQHINVKDIIIKDGNIEILL